MARAGRKRGKRNVKICLFARSPHHNECTLFYFKLYRALSALLQPISGYMHLRRRERERGMTDSEPHVRKFHVLIPQHL